MTNLSPKATLAKGALMVFLAPRLAQDARVALTPILADVTAKNFGSRKAAIIAGVREQVRGQLARDASIEGLAKLLDMLEASEGEDDLEPNAALPAARIDDPDDEMWRRRADDARRLLGRDETPEELEARECEQSASDARRRLGRDETPEESREREAKDKKARDARMTPPNTAGYPFEDLPRQGMDEALKYTPDIAHVGVGVYGSYGPTDEVRGRRRRSSADYSEATLRLAEKFAPGLEHIAVGA